MYTQSLKNYESMTKCINLLLGLNDVERHRLLKLSKKLNEAKFATRKECENEICAVWEEISRSLISR